MRDIEEMSQDADIIGDPFRTCKTNAVHFFLPSACHIVNITIESDKVEGLFEDTNVYRMNNYCKCIHYLQHVALTHDNEDNAAHCTLVWGRLQVKAHSSPCWTGTTQKPCI